jgi:nucleotide-binding universal stress UspA family protein
VTRAAPRGKSGRVLVAVDFSRASAKVAGLAAGLFPEAELQLFHSIDRRGEAALRAAQASGPAVKEYQRHRMKYAQQKMHELAGKFGGREQPARTVIGYGAPARQAVLQQEATRAGLVAVGKGESSAWEDFLCGSVAQSVLSWGTSDVLVVPQRS